MFANPLSHDFSAIDDKRQVNRRKILTGGARFTAGAALMTALGTSHAQAYPARPLKMIVAYPPAGATDILARLMGQQLSEKLGQAVVIDNKPGAGSTLGMEIASKQAADGYNLFLSAVTTQAIASFLYPTNKSTLANDFVPVGLIASAPHMLIVNNDVPAKTMGEFVQWLRSKNGDVNFASQGTGTLSHLESELLCQHLGVKATHIAYKGSSLAVTDLLSGAVSFMFDSVASAMPLVRAGKVRAIALASSTPVPAMPELPIISKAGIPGYNVDNWFGIFMPKGAPADTIAVIGKAMAEILQDPSTVAGLVQKGYIVTPGNAEKLASLAAQDYRRWDKVIRDANIKI